jgi:murein DD-endopeptidase MepM/ murein hydrolase activator NlpD
MSDLVFPLPVPPLTPFWQNNQTAFNHNRDGGERKHAGIDLEAHAGTPVLAMADGVVLRKAPFYEGTWAVEVQHPGLGIVRYGEVENPGLFVSVGQHIAKGQIIGRVGKRTGASRYMLHLELFSNSSDSLVNPNDPRAHPLTDKTNKPFQRRDDLVDPTKILMSAPLQNMTGLTFHYNRRKADNQKLMNILRHVSLIKLDSSGLPKL